MELIITAIGGAVVFALLSAVMLLKARRAKGPGPVKLHTCAKSVGCQCSGTNKPAKPFDLLEVLEKVKEEAESTPTKGCQPPRQT